MGGHGSVVGLFVCVIFSTHLDATALPTISTSFWFHVTVCALVTLPEAHGLFVCLFVMEFSTHLDATALRLQHDSILI